LTKSDITMHDATLTPFASLDRFRECALLVGVAGVVATAAGALVNPPQFFHSYLLAFFFWLAAAMGGLALPLAFRAQGDVLKLLAVGQPVRVEGQNFRVIGVLTPRGTSPMGMDMDNRVVVPLATALRRLHNVTWYTMIRLRLRPGADMAATNAALVRLLRQRRQPHFAARIYRAGKQLENGGPGRNLRLIRQHAKQRDLRLRLKLRHLLGYCLLQFRAAADVCGQGRG
jgi:hypothetical protein